jgi:hypothetical protein
MKKNKKKENKLVVLPLELAPLHPPHPTAKKAQWLLPFIYLCLLSSFLWQEESLLVLAAAAGVAPIQSGPADLFLIIDCNTKNL